ncbi:MAG: SGNH/GDSL hydrolase family protein [Woeseiaceae bacterium]|nr:SGNH/GDSL hydrolase family protein [Woeseiaceae bacterium]
MRSSLAFWAAVPLLAPQGLWVRMTAPRFAGAGGEAAGAFGDGPELTFVGFGDSTVAGVGARDYAHALVGQTARYLAERTGRRVRWRAHGIIGANTTRLLDQHFAHVDFGDADIVGLSVGVNDVTALTRLERWRRNLDELFDRINAANPDALVVFGGLPPLGEFPLLPQPLRRVLGQRARELDRVAREVVAAHPQGIYVTCAFESRPGTFAPDGYHPSEESYAVLGRVTADAIAARLAGR